MLLIQRQINAIKYSMLSYFQFLVSLFNYKPVYTCYPNCSDAETPLVDSPCKQILSKPVWIMDTEMLRYPKFDSSYPNSYTEIPL